MKKRGMTADDLLKFVFVGDTQMSPEGTHMLFSARRITEKNSYRGHLHQVSLDTGEIEQWTQGENGAGAGRYSPDGKWISFIAKREGSSAQIYVIPRKGGEAKKLTSLPEGDLGWYSWSPDGKWILVSHREPEPDRTEGAKKDREAKGLSTPPWAVDNLWYRLDGDGYFGSARPKLHLVEAAAGEASLLYAGDESGFLSCDWLPDSSGILIAHPQKGAPLLGPPDDAFWTVSVKGKVKKVKCPDRLSRSNPKVSPDGKTIAFFSHGAEGGWGTQNTGIWLQPLEGGPARFLTQMVDADFEVLTLSDTNAGHTSDGGGSGLLAWSPDGKTLSVSLGWRGEVQLARIDAETGEMTVVTKGKHCCVAGGSTPDRKRFSGYVGDPLQLNEVCLIDGESGEIKVLTSFNHWVNKEIELSTPEEVEIDTTDGLKVHAWVMPPVGWKGKKEQPAILEIHGGPHAQYGWAFFHEFQVLASEGYWVVFSNPRGSKGYGQGWCEAIRSNWGDKDWQDIEAVAQWMAKHSGMDSKRLGVMGGSYGGWMTNWVIGHTTLFRAAITDRCVSNMVSFAGNSDFPMNDGEYFGGVPYGSLERIAPLWRQSPLAYFEGVKTPTLIIHSEGDLRCNIEQSEQVFHALQSQGVESRFVRYPVNTSHGMSRGGPPDLRIHRLTEITNWWKKHLD